MPHSLEVSLFLLVQFVVCLVVLRQPLLHPPKFGIKSLSLSQRQKLRKYTIGPMGKGNLRPFLYSQCLICHLGSIFCG